MSRSRLLWFAVGLLALTSATLAFLPGQRHPRVRPDWTPQRLYEALVEAGEVWECRPGKRGALLCKRPGHPLSWEELLLLADRPSATFGAQPGRLHLVLVLPESQAFPEPTLLQLGRLLVRGHPDELKRLVACVAS